jgi:hypothetical protein
MHNAMGTGVTPRLVNTNIGKVDNKAAITKTLTFPYLSARLPTMIEEKKLKDPPVR